MTAFETQLGPEDFAPAQATPAQAQPRQPDVGFARRTAQQLLRRPAAVASLVVLALVILGAILLPMVCAVDYATQNVAFAGRPPMSRDPATGVLHLLGTDGLGRDLFARLWYGARISLLVAAAVAVIDSLVGVLYGSVAGYVGGAVETVLMRAVEVISGVPYLVVVLLLLAVLPQGIPTLILAYTLVGWTGMARLVRGQVAALSQREFVIAARITGAGLGRTIFRHLLPNTMGVVLVQMTLDIPGIIFTEAFLSMLGMGVPQPYPSLGVLINEGVAVFQAYPARLAIPAVLLCVTMLAFNLLGDSLQDALDPKRRRRSTHGKSGKH